MRAISAKPFDMAEIKPKERIVWIMLALGMTHREISEVIRIHVRSVGRIAENLYWKTNAMNVANLVDLAVRHRLIVFSDSCRFEHPVLTYYNWEHRAA